MLKFKRPRAWREVIACYNEMANQLEGYARELEKKLDSLAQASDEYGTHIDKLALLPSRVDEMSEAVSALQDHVVELKERIEELE